MLGEVGNRGNEVASENTSLAEESCDFILRKRRDRAFGDGYADINTFSDIFQV